MGGVNIGVVISFVALVITIIKFGQDLKRDSDRRMVDREITKVEDAKRHVEIKNSLDLMNRSLDTLKAEIQKAENKAENNSKEIGVVEDIAKEALTRVKAVERHCNLQHDNRG